MPDYVGPVLRSSNKKITKFITDNLIELAADNPKIKNLFTDGKIHDEIEDYPDESTLYVLVNVLASLVHHNRLDQEIINLCWERAQYHTVPGLLSRNLDINESNNNS